MAQQDKRRGGRTLPISAQFVEFFFKAQESRWTWGQLQEKYEISRTSLLRWKETLKSGRTPKAEEEVLLSICRNVYADCGNRPSDLHLPPETCKALEERGIERPGARDTSMDLVAANVPIPSLEELQYLRLGERVRAAAKRAVELAIERHHAIVGVPHLLAGLVQRTGDLHQFLADEGHETREVVEVVLDHLDSSVWAVDDAPTDPRPTNGWKTAFAEAAKIARNRHSLVIEESDIVLAILEIRGVLLESVGQQLAVSVSELESRMKTIISTPYK